MEKKRKPFFQSDVGRILKGVASIAAPSLVRTLESASSVGDAILKIRNATDVADETKIKLEEIALNHEQELTKRLEADTSSDSWLPKNIRPLTLVVLVCTYVIGFFLEYDVQQLQVPLVTVFGFYFGSRGIEKVTHKIMNK